MASVKAVTSCIEKRPATSLLQAFIHQPLDRSTDLKNAYLIGISRVMTAYYINGATRYGRVMDEDKKRNKALAELTDLKKKPQLLEVGFWSREVTQVQGGDV